METGYTREALGLAIDMRAVVERRRLQLAAARVVDGKLAMQRKDFRRIGKSGRLTRQLSTVAVMNAVDGCGRDVMKDEEYWKDQDRREFGIQDGVRSVAGMRNRLGRVSFRKIYYRDQRSEVRDQRTDQTDGTDGTDHTSMQNKNVMIMVN